MAGRGPVPKLPEQRRRRNEPARGEWVDLEPLEKPVLPAAGRDWSVSAKRMWAGWRDDPVTGRFGSSEVAAITELADRWEDLQPNEQRLRMDGLGLTLKGKRDLRFRLVDPQPVAAPRLAEVRELRAV